MSEPLTESKPSAVVREFCDDSGECFSYLAADPAIAFFFKAVVSSAFVSPVRPGENGETVLNVSGPDGVLPVRVPGPSGSLLSDRLVAVGNEPPPGAKQNQVAPAHGWFDKMQREGYAVIAFGPALMDASDAAPVFKGRAKGGQEAVTSFLLATRSIEAAATITNPEGWATQSHVDGSATPAQRALVMEEPSAGWLPPDAVGATGEKKNAESSSSFPLGVLAAVGGIGLALYGVKRYQGKR